METVFNFFETLGQRIGQAWNYLEGFIAYIKAIIQLLPDLIPTALLVPCVCVLMLCIIFKIMEAI